MRYYVSGVLVALAITTFGVRAQGNDSKIPVIVNSQCDSDSVGQRLVYRTREGIRQSSRMTEATDYNSSVVQLELICLDPLRDEAGSISRYSYAITAYNTDGYYDYFITYGVGSCGSSRVSECAESRIATLDQAIDDLIKRIRDGTFKFKGND